MLRLGMIVTFERNDCEQTAFVNRLDYPNVELRFYDHKEKKLASKVVDVRQVRPVEKPSLNNSITKAIIYNLALFFSATIMISLVFEVIHNYKNADESELNQICEKLGWLKSIFQNPRCFYQKPTFYKVIFFTF
jgi:hypothetical protein